MTQLADDTKPLLPYPVLTTKLHIPRTIADTLARPRLISRLRQARNAALIYISAPAGFGKSTLLAELAGTLDARPGWVSLDQGDNDLTMFWLYMIAAIDTISPGFMARTNAVLTLLEPSKPEPGIAMLLNELQRLEGPIVLFLDDFHVVTDSNVVSSFSYFIEHLPRHVQLVLAGRTEPPFPAAKLHSRDMMVRLDARDLRFTETEGADFYRHCMKLELSAQDAEELVKRTEGWVTAMKLAAMSVRDSHDPAALIRNFSGDYHVLEQYLLEEVFHGMDERLQFFIMECSVLQRMNAALCKAVTGCRDSQSMLDDLERMQLFVIPLDERKIWYRFHHLFSEFAFRRLQRADPERLPALYAAAGAWCEDEGLHEEALDYYLSGKHYNRAVRLLEEMTATMIRMNWTSLYMRLSEVPESLLLQSPSLYFSKALTLLFGDRKYSLVERMLLRAEERFEASGGEWTEEEKNDFLGSLYFVRAFYASQALDDMNLVIHNMKQSRLYKPTGTKLVFAQSVVRAKHSIVKEHASSHEGYPSMDIVIPFLNQLIETVEALGLAGSALVSVSEHMYELNELEASESYARRAIESTDFNNPLASEALVPAWLLLSRIRKAQGLRSEAEDMLREAKTSVIRLGIPSALIYCDAELARLALDAGDLEPAEAWIGLYRISAADSFTAQQLYEYQFLARILLAQDRLAEARELAERLLAVAVQAGRNYHRDEIHVLQSLILSKMGETEAALNIVKRTLHITGTDFVRLYVDEGRPMAEMLAMLNESLSLPRDAESPPATNIRRLLACLGNAGGKEDSPSPFALLLTKKEQEVFRLIVQGLTNKEIAEKLGIGYGTVRSHINRIYGKLQVESRDEAIRKGYGMGL
ncbi:LuxR C-terminal-related transcriptional regulator [Paenibacillus sp. MSJ-34]|uniref:LuxR C-terminal-related transcriptional regulator n=1 Tax=Paenibacillus sp. MSJ-34 TaxID=2841529 RepID=UPI001C105B27|nr:LuxR C-terminal-related transcriptional regulator [Paenibacillus sp. MSJ-34]